MVHNAEINAIFVGNRGRRLFCSCPYLYYLKLSLQISKIVTMNAQEGAGNKDSALSFILILPV